ncbi:phage holin family protein [Microbacterium arborescens]|uniref:phage holin family protein n=1 Tax=Microbacterium arborescens TaxID=33883 RepID=UPI003C754325
MNLVIRLIVNAFAIWIVTLIPALQVSVAAFPPGGDLQLVLTLLLIAVIFGLVNAIVGTVLKVLALPLYILTLGLISFVINGFLLWLTGWVTSGWDWGLRIGDFWLAVLAAIVITLINGVAGILFRPRRDRDRVGRDRR